MCKKRRDEGEDFGLAGVSSKVRTDNVLIVSIFAMSSMRSIRIVLQKHSSVLVQLVQGLFKKQHKQLFTSSTYRAA